MPSFVRDSGGLYKPIKGIRIRGASAFADSMFGRERRPASWLQFYANEVVATLDNAVNVNAQSLFSAPDWASSKIKRVVLPAGKKLGSNSNTLPALRSGTAWGGQLIFELAGDVEGTGGPINSGVGGDAFWAEAPGILMGLTGSLKAGGGGGGRAGNGGAGTFNSPIQEGPIYAGGPPTYIWWVVYEQGYNHIYWNTSNGSPMAVTPIGNTSWFDGSTWTYYRGAQQTTDGNGNPMCAIYRQRPNYIGSSGGIAGNGGRGQGYDGAATAGAAPVVGGSNAGVSGKSGDGGVFGQPGQAGANGAAGNNGAGTSGLAAGLAGFSIANPTNVTLTGSGARLGR